MSNLAMFAFLASGSSSLVQLQRSALTFLLLPVVVLVLVTLQVVVVQDYLAEV
jgi:hypothetical protein